MADHTITIQSEGLGSPIRGSNEPNTFAESSKLLAEEIRNLLKEMQKSNPDATYKDAQRQFHQDLNSTASARNAGRPDVWQGQEGRGDTAGYNLQPVVAGGDRGEVPPYSGPQPARNPWEVLDRWNDGESLASGGIMEEEALLLDAKRDSSQGHFGRGSVSDDGFYSDWRDAKNARKTPNAEAYQRAEDISSDEYNDREDAIAAMAGGDGGGGYGGGRNNEPAMGNDSVGDLIEDTGEALGDAASDIPFVGGSASGAIKATATTLRAGISLADQAIGSAGNAAVTLGTGAVGATAGVIGSDNVSESLQAFGTGVSSVTGAMSDLGGWIPVLGPVIDTFGAAIEGATMGLGAMVSAMDAASEEVMGFNPNILMERINTEMEVLFKQMQRAEIVGDELAEYEEARGDMISVMEDIKTILIKVLGPIVTKILKMVTELLERFLENIPHMLNALASGIEALATIAAQIPGIGGAVGGVLTNIQLGIQGMAADAAAALAALRGPATPADLGFGNWLLGGTVDAQQVPGVNHPRIPFGLNP